MPGSLPWVFRTALDPVRDREWIAREWFVPVAVETAVDADDIESFCIRAGGLVRGLPGSLAASVTAPTLPASDRERVELLVEHLEHGVVAVNTWSALAYSLASVPWGGFPSSTLASPRSGIGRVHDPLLLPLVHNAILRAPLAPWPVPPWLPWHPDGGRLARFDQIHRHVDAGVPLAAHGGGLIVHADRGPAGDELDQAIGDRRIK